MFITSGASYGGALAHQAAVIIQHCVGQPV
jgi:hypothetical protein